MRPPTSLLLLSTATAAYANKHHVFVGSFGTPDIFNLEFDTSTNVLRQAARYSAHAGHASLVFNYDKKTLYGAERDGWASYSVDSAGKVRFQSNLTVATSPCPGEGNNVHGRTSVFAQVRPPYNVFGSAQRSCGNVISTKADGSLGGVLQSINYGSNSRIFSMVADPNDNYVYSADLKGNGIWVHQVDPNSGALTPVTFTAFPEADARPRRLALHSNSKYLYVLLSRTNTVGVYEVTGPNLKYTGINYSLVPQGADPNRYIGQDILLSADDNILYASARYVPPRPASANSNASQQEDADKDDEDEPETVDASSEDSEEEDDDDSKRTVKLHKTPKATKATRALSKKNPGYVTAIRLTDDVGSSAPQYGPGAPGFPIDVVFQVPTSTSGGRSNALVPAPWGNEYFALTDSEVGMVQIWKVEGLNAVLRQAQDELKRTKSKRQQAPADPGQNGGQYLGDLIQPAQQDPNQQQQQPPSQQDPFQQQPPAQDNNQPWSPPSQPLNPDGSIPGYQPAQQPTYQQQPQPQYQPDPSGQWGQAPQSPYQVVSYPYNQPATYPQQPPPAAVPVPAPAPTPAPAASSGWGWWGSSTPATPASPAPAPAPRPAGNATPTAYNQGLLTGLLGGVVGGPTTDPGLTGALLGINGGKGLLGGGGLLGLGILKKRTVFAKQPSQQAVITGAIPGISAKVVAQWNAPRDVVGSADGDLSASRVVHAGRYAALQRREEEMLAKRNGDVAVGGGCCSGAFEDGFFLYKLIRFAIIECMSCTWCLAYVPVCPSTWSTIVSGICLDIMLEPLFL